MTKRLADREKALRAQARADAIQDRKDEIKAARDKVKQKCKAVTAAKRKVPRATLTNVAAA